MAQSFKDWLGAFIESELSAVVQWKSHIKPEPGTRDELNDRFGDDGSNLQSTVTSAHMPAESQLQLIKVLAVDDVPTILVSDGFTSIKATLSDVALAALEVELDEKLTLEMRGDVISLTDATVISTPYGPADGFVQLHINALEYRYSLRKTLKDTIPLHQHAGIITLLDQITAIRHRPVTSQEENAVEEEDAPSVVQPPSPEPMLGASQLDLEDAASQPSRPGSPVTQPALASQGPLLPGTVSTRDLPSVATQPPPRKKLRGPTMEADGFETQMGINLARPMAAPNGAYGTTPTSYQPQPRTVQKHATVSTSATHLLGLLAPRKAQSPPESVAKLQRPEPIVIEDDEPTPMDIDPSSINFTKVTADAQNQAHAQIPSSPPEIPVLRSAPRPAYARRKPSQNQRKLLDSPHSWFPSLPGRTFPSPNVPIQLLATWNSMLPPPSASSSQNTSSHPAPSPAQHDGGRSILEESASTSDSSSDEELGPSQWPPSSSPPREQLPPDSSAATAHTNKGKSVVADHIDSSSKSAARTEPSHGSTKSSQGAASPSSAKGLFRDVAQKPSQGSTNRLRHDSTSSLSRAEAPKQHRKDPDRSPSGSMNSYSNSPPHLEQHLPLRKIPTQVIAPQTTIGTSRPLTNKGGFGTLSPVSHPLRAKPPLQSSGSETVIKGTQYSAMGDEMELDVPRALPSTPVTRSGAPATVPMAAPKVVPNKALAATPMVIPRAAPPTISASNSTSENTVDPMAVHRRRRTEHFRKMHRQNWLKANYVMITEGQPYVHDVLKAFRATHPEDPMTGSELAVLQKEVFPGLSGFPPKSLKPKVPITDPFIPPTGQFNRLSTEGMHEADVPYSRSKTDRQQLRPNPIQNPGDLNARLAKAHERGRQRHAPINEHTPAQVDFEVYDDAHDDADAPAAQGKVKDRADDDLGTKSLPSSTHPKLQSVAQPTEAPRSTIMTTAAEALMSAVQPSQTLSKRKREHHLRQLESSPEPSNKPIRRPNPPKNHDHPGDQLFQRPTSRPHTQDPHNNMSKLQEFALAWKQIKPGGAFATPSISSTRKGKLTRSQPPGGDFSMGVDVLSWGL